MIKIELEYILNTSAKVLFPRLSSSSGLSEWFADDVSVKDGVNFTFTWGETHEKATLLDRKPYTSVRFKWLHIEDSDAYFEFKLETHDLTRDLALIITDFVNEDEKDSAIELWESQINELKSIIGA